MKKALVKIPAMLAMLITGLSIFTYVWSLVDMESEIWVIASILAILSLPLYFTDAIISFVKTLKKDDTTFNLILTLVLVGTIPMYLLVGDRVGIPLCSALWNLYYLFVLVLEIWSIKRCIKTNSKN